MSAAARPWWEDELAGCVFADARLGERLRRIVGRINGALGASLPFACQDWAGTKAAYRFFSNTRVSEAQILAGHFQATRERVSTVSCWTGDRATARCRPTCSSSRASAAILPGRGTRRQATS